MIHIAITKCFSKYFLQLDSEDSEWVLDDNFSVMTVDVYCCIKCLYPENDLGTCPKGVPLKSSVMKELHIQRC